MPRPVLHTDHLPVPEGVTVEIKSGKVTVKGPRGTLERDFGDLHLDFEYQKEENQIVARCWFGNRKLVARIGTLFGHIKNMFTGVQVGYRYKMRFVSSHFPIKHVIGDKGEFFAFTHFMGNREKHTINMPEGCICTDKGAQKEEIWIEGNDLEKVSQACAQIHQLTRIKNKDLRKFLDGIYVSERGHIAEE